MGEPTRPAANVEAEPVAWMYRQMTTAEADHVEFTRTPWFNIPPSWTEEALVRASALEQVRKDAVEAVIHACYVLDIGATDARYIAKQILKDQANG